MKNLFVIIIMGGLVFSVNSQTYTHPTTGINSEFVGSCLESTCTGTYIDNGGAGNYSNNINAIYRVFCPDTPGNCVRLTFNSMDIEAYWFGYYDYLTIGNGPTQNSTLFTSTGGSDINGRITGTPATPFSYTSTHASGCLTTRFVSDGSVTRPGWSATISCVPCVGGPTGLTNSDCSGLTQLCTNAIVPANSTGPGIVAEGCNGSDCPAGGENHTNWYAFEVQTSGTLAFTISPTIGTADYDFALFGPNVDCATLGSPIRCSDAGVSGATGMVNGAGDTDEDVNGNGALEDLNVTAGEVYVLMIDEWTLSGAGYNLTFTGTSTFDCTPLSVQLSDFTAAYSSEDDIVDLYWSTESEMNSNYFDIEVSQDNKTWEKVATIQGAGNAAYKTEYFSYDSRPQIGTNYYRLKQVDFDGEEKYFNTISVFVDIMKAFQFDIHPNPTHSSVNLSFESMTNEMVTIDVLNQYGKKVYSYNFDCKIGYNTSYLDLTDQTPGLYIIQITNSSGTFQSKLIKE